MQVVIILCFGKKSVGAFVTNIIMLFVTSNMIHFTVMLPSLIHIFLYIP